MLNFKRITATALAAVMSFSLAAPVLAAENTVNDVTTEDYSVYVAIDPTIVDDDDFVVEPVKINVPKGTDKSVTLGEIVLDELDELGIGYTGSASYISGIQCAAANSFELPASVAAKYPDAAFDSRIMVLPSSASVPNGYLVEKEFTGYSGWMMTLDNETSVADSSLA